MLNKLRRYFWDPYSGDEGPEDTPDQAFYRGVRRGALLGGPAGLLLVGTAYTIKLAVLALV